MDEREFQKARAEIQGLRGEITGSPRQDEQSCAPQREPAKFRLRRVIEQVQREGAEAQTKAMELQALFNALPEQLSPQADAALDDLLTLQLKRY